MFLSSEILKYMSHYGDIMINEKQKAKDYYVY